MANLLHLDPTWKLKSLLKTSSQVVIAYSMKRETHRVFTLSSDSWKQPRMRESVVLQVRFEPLNKDVQILVIQNFQNNPGTIWLRESLWVAGLTGDLENKGAYVLGMLKCKFLFRVSEHWWSFLLKHSKRPDRGRNSIQVVHMGGRNLVPCAGTVTH